MNAHAVFSEARRELGLQAVVSGQMCVTGSELLSSGRTASLLVTQPTSLILIVYLTRFRITVEGWGDDSVIKTVLPNLTP